jgi:hypothetical protein
MSATKRKDYVGTIGALKILLTAIVAGETVTINGLVYTAVNGAKANNTEFSADTSDTAAATDLADSINNDVRSGTYEATLVATSSGTQVTVTATSTNINLLTAESNDQAIITVAESFTLLSLASNSGNNNPTLKQVNFMNTPFSVQSSGADKEVWKSTTARLLQIDTETKFNALAVRDRVLNGSREGWISAHVASTSLEFTYLDITKTEISKTLTMAEVFASGDLFFLNEDF